jgi:hypothetical protein
MRAGSFAEVGCYVPLWRGKVTEALYTQTLGGGCPPPKTRVFDKFEFHPLQRGTYPYFKLSNTLNNFLLIEDDDPEKLFTIMAKTYSLPFLFLIYPV